MESFKKIFEAVEFNTSAYEFSTGKKPKGRGGWFFGDSKDADVSDPKQTFSVNANYADAKKQAQKWAKENKISTIYVLP